MKIKQKRTLGFRNIFVNLKPLFIVAFLMGLVMLSSIWNDNLRAQEYTELSVETKSEFASPVDKSEVPSVSNELKQKQLAETTFTEKTRLKKDKNKSSFYFSGYANWGDLEIIGTVSNFLQFESNLRAYNIGLELGKYVNSRTIVYLGLQGVFSNYSVTIYRDASAIYNINSAAIELGTMFYFSKKSKGLFMDMALRSSQIRLNENYNYIVNHSNSQLVKVNAIYEGYGYKVSFGYSWKISNNWKMSLKLTQIVDELQYTDGLKSYKIFKNRSNEYTYSKNSEEQIRSPELSTQNNITVKYTTIGVAFSY